MLYRRHILVRHRVGELIAAVAARPRTPIARVHLDPGAAEPEASDYTELFKQIDARRAPAVTVFTTNSTAIVNLGRFDLPASQAVSAAVLAAQESYSGDSDGFQTSASVLDSRRCGPSHRSSVLTVSERESVLVGINQRVREAGGVLRGVVPMRAALAATMYARATALIRRDGVTDRVLLHIGEDNTGIAVIHEGRVLSLRTMGYGYNLMIDALVSAAERLDGAGRMDRARARELFVKSGIPRPDTAIDTRSGLTGRHLLPLIQPVVQRYTLELKQTLRLPGDAPAPDRCDLIGSGAATAGLAETLERSAGMTVAPATDNDGLSDAMALPRGLESSARGDLALLPVTQQWNQRKNLVYRSVAAGTAVAAAALVAESVLVRLETGWYETRIAELGPQVSAIEHHDSTVSSINAVTDEVRSAMTWTSEELGARPLWSVLLADLGRAFGEHAELNEIRASDRAGTPALMLHWYEFDLAEQDTDHSPVLDRLAELDGIDEVVLEARRQLVVDERPTTEYRVRADLRIVDNDALIELMGRFAAGADASADASDADRSAEGGRP